MWASNLPGLAAARITYALDALGDAGLSVQIQPIHDATDQADWLDQVLRQIYPRVSGESIARSWQRPASQAARVSWMSCRVWLSAVI